MSLFAFILALLLSFAAAFLYAAILYFLDRFEKEPKRLLVAAFAWGAVVATVGAMVGTIVLQMGVHAFTGDAEMAEVTGMVLFAPIVEELTKGLAVLLVFLFFRHEFDSVLDGMIYGGITALGFAATENVLYLYFRGYQEHGLGGMLGLFLLRVVLGGWSHAAFTACFGAGLALARLSRNPLVRIGAPLAGLAVAMAMHALHNAMATFLGAEFGLGGLALTLAVDWIGWAAVFVLFLLALNQERTWLLRYLPEEVSLGTISEAHLRIARSLRAQFRARLRIRGARPFYQACAELAQKKHQLATMGEECGNTARIEALRARLRAMTPPPT